MIRAVLDANVFVSALIRPEGPPGRIFVELVERRAFALVLSAPILDEIRRTLSSPRVRRFVHLTGPEMDAWRASVQGLGELVEARGVRVVAGDPDDDKYFAVAIAGDADIVVSGDRHVLEVRQFEGIRVLAPRAFLEKLRI